MCSFKPGDEAVCIYDVRWWENDPSIGRAFVTGPSKGETVRVRGIALSCERLPGLLLEGYEGLWDPTQFRKVQRRDLTEWLSIATDFEEPKRAPAKRRERA